MRKSTLILLAGAISLVGLWLSSWPERAWQYFRHQPEGKVWHAEREKQMELYPKSAGIYFLGDSHMEQCEWAEIFPGIKLANRGIPGETTTMLLQRIPGLLPDSCQVFLQIGINDLLSGMAPDQLLDNYKRIVQQLQKQQVQLLPTLIFPTYYKPDVNKKVVEVNQLLAQYFTENGIQFLDINQKLQANGKLSLDYSWDGIHLNAMGYRIWARAMQPSIEKREHDSR